MIPIWIGKIVANKIIKSIKHKIDLKKIDKYVNKPNELDIQIKQLRKVVNKQGRYIEELEKNVALLKRDSHPPVFSKSNYKNVLKRIKKLEKSK